MLIEAIDELRRAGVTVETVEVERAVGEHGRPDALLTVAGAGATVQFVVEAKARAPYPNELHHLDRQMKAMAPEGRPLLVVPFVPEPLGRRLTEAGWSWADAEGNFDLRAPGLLLRQRRTASPPRRKARSLPQGSGGLAIVRALIRLTADEAEELSATALAAHAGVTQPRVSQVVRRLRDLGLLEVSERGQWRPDREALLDRFLAEYPGPRGSERFGYSLDSPADVALIAARLHAQENPVVVSADVGPDLITPWRRPSAVIIYTRQEIRAHDLGLVEAQSAHDANVFVRIPDDQSVFPTPPEPTVKFQGVDVRLADPSQMIWDLQDLGGSDRLEAAGMLRQWLHRH